ncbi:DEAD/DEAH box helicase [bacterium]|nr:DEAD/DEAH box helicase [bacterium]
MSNPTPARDDYASQYLDALQYEPYPVQEEALLAWFTCQQGVLICAPTGTGKTLIAEAALFEALHAGSIAYYTTPLIALTEQKFHEIQQAAVRWGFRAEDVGLVTGNRKVNPDARVLVVVAEILLNRLLHREAHDFSGVSAVVMDEFHSFNDPERGIVWELTLELLPKHVRLMLLSATVGNTAEFLGWLYRSHGRRLDLIQSTERKVPLRFHWIEDQLLTEQIEIMASGDEESRRTPMLLFCFNREECWSVAETLKGKSIIRDEQQKLLVEEVKQHDWSKGIGPKLKTLLLRGVAVHHAGLLPKFKRIVEDLFQRKLLSVCVCTETLAAGMNLPARSVLLTSLLKGPPGKKTLIDPSSAHQMFGRAGRPQFDTDGHVYAIAHEDDVRILRFKQRLDQIPEDTKDPLLIKKRKQLKKKMPTRRKTEQYWNEAQFQKLIDAPPASLRSQGPMPWRLLAYLLSLSADVSLVRSAISKRLMDDKGKTKAQRRLVEMLRTLEAAGYVTLAPPPPVIDAPDEAKPLAVQVRELAADGRFGETAAWTGNYVDPADAQAQSEVVDEDEFGSGLLDEDDEMSLDPGAEEAPSSSAEPDAASQTTSPVTQTSIAEDDSGTEDADSAPSENDRPGGAGPAEEDSKKPQKLTSSLKFLLEAQGVQIGPKKPGERSSGPRLVQDGDDQDDGYEPAHAYQTETLAPLLTFRSVNPLYGMFLVELLPYADGAERIQALESVLAFPGGLSRALRIPRGDVLPPSLFTREFLDPELLQRGVASAAELGTGQKPDEDEPFDPDEWIRPLNFPEKLLRLFRSEFPAVTDIPMTDVWAAGELLHFGGDFNKLITTRRLAKQEGIVFRHVLRFILLCDEFLQHVPVDSAWRSELLDVIAQLTDACRRVDTHCTEMMIESARSDDLLGEDEGGRSGQSDVGAV